MWILIKLAVMFGAFIYRLRGKVLSRGFSSGEVEGNPYFIHHQKKSHVIVSTRVGIDFTCPAVFTITKEGYWDRLFKRLMVNEEVQTGDADFDQSFYLSSDAPAFHQVLKGDPTLREIIRSLFNHGCQRISCDGTTLWCQFVANQKPDLDLVKRCFALFQSLGELGRLTKDSRPDPFAVKIFIIEALIYSLTAYAWTGFFEWYFFREDLHLNPVLIMRSGLAVGIFLTVSFVALVMVALRGSSRAHRVLIESAVVLFLSVPIGGLYLVRDVNIGLDRSVPWVVRAKVLGTYEQESKDYKGRRNYAYYLEVDVPQAPPEVQLPQRIRISGLKYAELTNARFVTITIGKGFLNYPWYKKIEGHALPN